MADAPSTDRGVSSLFCVLCVVSLFWVVGWVLCKCLKRNLVALERAMRRPEVFQWTRKAHFLNFFFYDFKITKACLLK